MSALGAELEAPKPDCELIASALEALGLAAFICTAEARVCAFTAHALSAVAAGRLRIAEGRLTTGAGFEPRALARAIAAAASPVHARPRAAIVVGRDVCDVGASQVLDVVAAPPARSPLHARAHAIVLVRGAATAGDSLELILNSAFGLTRAEAQVASHLATGRSRRSIAQARGVSLQTLRAQVRTIFEKMNVTRERELMHVLARLTSR